MPLVLALDQGTTSTRAILFDENGEKRGVAQTALEQHFPAPGWVEHDPVGIWQDQLDCARKAIESAGVSAADIAAIGVTNQRETVVVWDRDTGEPIHNAIVWQDRRTSAACEELGRTPGVESLVHERTGLNIDPYFSATKIAWILDHVEGARARAEAGHLLAGTIDSWLIWNLTGGTTHVTDVTNASRTLLADISTAQWDHELCEVFRVPACMLPRIVRSSGTIAMTESSVLGAAVPIAAACGDQQAALAGNGCFSAGEAKVTFGTGIFALMHTGHQRPHSDTLAVTLAAQVDDTLNYALEGSIFMGGAVVQWMVEGLHAADSPAACQALAESVPDTGGVVMVPALTGLGAPEWDPYARGAIFGITRGTTAAHIARAGMEAIAFQVGDLAGAMAADSGHPLTAVRADGGVTVNRLIMATLADVLGIPVQVADVAESTALGAAYLAGRAVGVWSGEDTLPALTAVGHSYEPDPGAAAGLDARTHQWREAVRRSLRWAAEETQA